MVFPVWFVAALGTALIVLGLVTGEAIVVIIGIVSILTRLLGAGADSAAEKIERTREANRER